MQVNSQNAMLCEIWAEVFLSFCQYGESAYMVCVKNTSKRFGFVFEFNP